MTGWRGNDLGLVKWQVLFVHDWRLKLVQAVQDMVLAGKPFEEAKKAVIAKESPAWRGLTPDVREGIERCAKDIRFSDMSEPVFRAIEEQIIQHHGKRSTPLRRFLLRVTGKVW